MSGKDNSLNLDIDSLVQEYEQLSSEIEEIDSLYTNSKELLDESSKGSRANYVFIANQTSNLISIKSHKMSLIKTMNDIKKSIIDLKIKEYNLNSKNNTLDDNTKEVIENLFKKMMNMDTKDLIEASIEEHLNEEKEQLTDEDFDRLLEERLNEDKRTKKEEKIIIEEPKFKIVIEDEFNSPLIVDMDYNLIEEDDSEEFNKLKLKSEQLIILEIKENENGESIAIDSNGEVFEVVES